MSLWHPSIDIALLAATDVAVVVAVTAATAVLAAPDPTVASVAVITTAELIATAPDPASSATLDLDTATLLLIATDPERVGDETIAVPHSTVGLIAVDPTFVQPSRLRPPPAMLNLTGPDPTIDYGFVSSTTSPTFPGVPPASSQGQEHRRQIAAGLNRAIQGKIACTGTFTLIASVPATYWRDPRLGADSWVEFDPLTADAVAEKAAGTMYVLEANRQEGQWLITHANGPSANRKFRFSILG